MHQENNYEEFKEIRSRVDSIATAVFLIAGGALSLSINVMLGNKGKIILTEGVINNTTLAWYFLLTSVVLFLILKIQMIAQAMLLQFFSEFVNSHLKKFNITSWIVGGSAFITFVFGMVKMVQAAVGAIGS